MDNLTDEQPPFFPAPYISAASRRRTPRREGLRHRRAVLLRRRQAAVLTGSSPRRIGAVRRGGGLGALPPRMRSAATAPPSARIPARRLDKFRFPGQRSNDGRHDETRNQGRGPGQAGTRGLDRAGAQSAGAVGHRRREGRAAGRSDAGHARELLLAFRQPQGPARRAAQRLGSPQLFRDRPGARGAGRGPSPISARCWGIWLGEDPSFPAFDIAIRNWARKAANVAETTRRVDDAWIALLKELFLRSGYGDTESFVRARVAYFHQVGYYALALKEDLHDRLQLSPYYYKALTGVRGRPPTSSRRSPRRRWRPPRGAAARRPRAPTSRRPSPGRRRASGWRPPEKPRVRPSASPRSIHKVCVCAGQGIARERARPRPDKSPESVQYPLFSGLI